jgi:DegV family protein with EDD domain
MIRIITDSTSDVKPAEWEKLGVTVLPLSVNFDAKSYLDGVDLTNDVFYEMLGKAERLPTTSQINPDAFVRAFQKYVDDGDDVVGIFISSNLSGTYNAALIAAQEVNADKIFLVDSRIGTFGLAIIVLEAVKMRDAGMGAAEITDNLKKLVKRIRLVAMVDTLKYLRMGGRISATSTLVGGILGIRPMVDVMDGAIQNVGKVRGKHPAMQFILKYLNTHPVDTDLTFSIGHSNAQEECNNLREFLKNYLPVDRAFIGEIGAVIGTYIGPGAFGIAYFEKE